MDFVQVKSDQSTDLIIRYPFGGGPAINGFDAYVEVCGEILRREKLLH